MSVQNKISYWRQRNIFGDNSETKFFRQDASPELSVLAISACKLGAGFIGNDHNGFAKLAGSIKGTRFLQEVVARFHSQKGFVLCKVAGIPLSCHAQKCWRCSTMDFCSFLTLT